MKIKEINTPDAAAAEKDYYTKDEVERIAEMWAKRYVNVLRDETVSDIKETNYRITYLSRRVDRLEETLKEAEEIISRYLDKEKEARRRAALERLNSGAYDFEDDIDEEEEKEKN